MDALRVVADDLTGACDVGAELLPGPGGVVVQPSLETRGPVPPGAMCVRNTQSRTLAPTEASRRVAAALADVGPAWAGLVLKKIDTGLRGPLGAEVDATMDALGVEEAFVLPAIPEVGRTTLAGRQMIGGVPVDETAFARDPHHPIRDASVLTALASTGRRQVALIDIAAIRGDLAAAIERARAAGAGVLACDAETDADLERAVRALLLRGRPLLLVGSTGLARALRRVLGTEQAGRALRPAGPAPLPGDGILVVAGSAHPCSRRQLERAAGHGLVRPIEVPSLASADWAGAQAARALASGMVPALVAPAAASPEGSAGVLAALRRAALSTLARV
ncbi:MAG TPA: four-carbon acid sugar kinase family protein, partial [Verrucomicrobiae bacterium]|nr:four-carbon acid sugar kinase family protein [Verrucomicrobiae bacterium]